MTDFLDDARYMAWLARVRSSGTIVNDVRLLATVRRGAQSFAGLVDAELVDESGRALKRCMLIRGDSVVVVPVIRPSDGSPPYTLMVEQHRPIDGLHTLEFVGGMLAPGEAPASCAAKEVREELGLSIELEALRALHAEPIRVCTAVMDERAHMFMFSLEVEPVFRRDIEGAHTGEHADGEWIRVRAIDFAQVGEQPVFSAQVGLRLVENVLGHRFWVSARAGAS